MPKYILYKHIRLNLLHTKQYIISKILFYVSSLIFCQISFTFFHIILVNHKLAFLVLSKCHVIKLHCQRDFEWEDLSLICSVDDMRQMTAVMQFLENYPTEPVVVELKSKTLTEKLLDGVVKVCDAEARKYIGQKQVGPKFLLYLSLCACTYMYMQILNLLWF